MSFCCTISGEAPQEPVISVKTGRVYEKRLLQKYVDENGKEPQTDHELTEDDIILVHSDPPTVRPRPPTLTSIPSLLATFQNEWDSLMLETFTLKQQYQQVRQELSQALYQNDASCRVIARLIKERDEAREALASLHAQVGTGSAQGIEKTTEPSKADANGRMEVDNSDAEKASPEEVYYTKVEETAKKLFKSRVKRKLPADLTPPSAWASASKTNTVEALHSSTKPGILTLDIDVSGELALTGGVDNHVEVYSVAREQTVATLKGHTKNITAALWVNGGGMEQTIITSSADKTIRIWSPKPANSNPNSNVRSIGWIRKHTIAAHNSEITGLSIHPCGEYFISGASDGTWAIHSFDGETIIQESIDGEITQIAFHPDGQFVGICTSDGDVRIVDVKQKQTLATLDVAADSESKSVLSLSFSENGYYFAVATRSIAAVWDLRKQRKVREWTDGAEFAAVRFDKTGGYLAIAGTDVRVFQVKGWNELRTLPESSDVTSISWIGDMTTGLVTASTTSSLCYYIPEKNE